MEYQTEWPSAVPTTTIVESVVPDSEWNISEEEIASIEAAQAEQEWWENNPQRLMRVSALRDYIPEPMFVDGYIPRKGIGQLFGGPGSGKTYAAVDLALSIAAGLPEWMGLPLNVPEPLHVVYVAAEGGGPFRDAVVAWMDAHPGNDERLEEYFHVLDGGKSHTLVMHSPKDDPAQHSYYRLKREIEAVSMGEKVGMLVTDPQINVFAEIDENNNNDMMLVWRQLKNDADTEGYLHLSVHHTGHDGSRARGASSQRGMLDLEVALFGKNRKGHMEFRKVKGCAYPEHPLKFRLDPIQMKDDGREGVYMVPNGFGQTKEQSKADETQKLIEQSVSFGNRTLTAIKSDLQMDHRLVSRHVKTLLEQGRIVNKGTATRFDLELPVVPTNMYEASEIESDYLAELQ